MDTSFYAAAQAAVSQQQKMNVVANNIANVNTTGYKTKNAVFYDLINYNLRDFPETRTGLQAGSGVVVGRTDTSFEQGILENTGISTHYAISGRGFFMLSDPQTGEISYTRDGTFSWSLNPDGQFYLVSDSGYRVLDEEQNPITASAQMLQGLDEEEAVWADPGVYTFPIERGLQNAGHNTFTASEANGALQLAEDASLMQGYTEMSNVDLADEMAKTVEASRAYSYVLKMIQTADEVEQTINSLR